jgi:hypothetical protein
MTTEARGPAAIFDDDLCWTAVSAESVCPVCAARSGCGVAPFEGGIAVSCRYRPSAAPMTEGAWLHRLSAADVVALQAAAVGAVRPGRLGPAAPPPPYASPVQG